MGLIRVLSDPIVNKIAAGEVIERPASVVKELVENAIDAHATQIDVTLEAAGSRLIRVVDDGNGLAPDDLALAVLPHATSKIADETDLDHIATFGFRGEALASIGAVAQLTVRSRPRGGDAHEITVDAGRISDVRPAAGPVGTTIEVRNLFYAVPARRKFLRQPATEFSHVVEQVARMAMPYSHVGFSINHNGRETHRLDKTHALTERIAAFYGRELADALIRIETTAGDVRLHGYVAPPAMSRATAKWQMFFVNGRYIRDRAAQHAIREAFRGLTEVNRHPVAFLFLDLPPDRVDVNVHPTKSEVRWRETGTVHSIIMSALRESLAERDLTPTFAADRGRVDTEQQSAVIAAMAEFFRQAEPPEKQLRFDAPPARSSAAPMPEIRRPMAPIRPPADAPLPSPTTTDAPTQPAASPAPAASAPADIAADMPRGPIDKAIQIHNTYLVVEADDGMIIIDQHALHERILFEQLLDRVAAGPLEAQRLLIPETVAVSDKQMALADEWAEQLRRLGLETTAFGPNTLAVQSCPNLLSGASIAGLLLDVLDRIADAGEADAVDDAVRDVLNMMACKAAVKAGDPLTPAEIEALLAKRHLIDRSSNCPHGRPTTLRLTVRDLEREFKRA